ncbi:serine/threonine-protein kinase LMTK1-like [Dermacentor albipictus]|uniref:serine/threonine-protein kinase LMTK1-like n=1 Tax=Dermacentor albipictus TaxID=60249 RepID=UPI0031FD19BB
MPTTGSLWSAAGLAVLLVLVCQASGHPIEGGDASEKQQGIPGWSSLSGSVWVIGASVCFALTVAIVASLGCLCCRNEGIKLLGTRNGVSVPHLPLGSMAQQRSSLSPEVTIFPPAAAAPRLAFAAPPTPFDDKVSFEPLPKIFPRLPASPSKHPLRPAHYSGELGGTPSSVHDWFDDPQANFPRERLQYLQELGVGWFGQAVRGEAQNLNTGRPSDDDPAVPATTTPVVVKILRSDATPTEHICFLHEVQHLRLLRHPHLLQLLGRCLESDPFLLILEDSVMDLKAFLLSKRPEAEPFLQGPIPLQAACAIASALDHMHRHSFVHVDLAARSCVIDRNQVVKVGDYGTSLQAYKEDYHLVGEVAVPLRWTAPESLHCTDLALEARELSKEANVWSFGVLLWELLSLGALPYEGLTDDEVLRRVVVQRNLVPARPTTPAGRHTDRLYQVATWCWSEVPGERPSVHELRELLGHLQRENSDAHDFESRWAALRPDRVKEHNLAPNHPAAMSLSRLGFESDFVAASLQNLHGSAEDLRTEPTVEEEEELTSFHISEAIRDLDAILAAESGSTASVDLPSESMQRQDSLGTESVDSRELNSLGFKKSASVEDLLREGPEKVAEMFRITVIDDVDASGSEPRSLGADSDIWRRLEDGSSMSAPGNGALNGGVGGGSVVSPNVGIWGGVGGGDTVQVTEVVPRSIESDSGLRNPATREDVSSRIEVAGRFGGGCTSAHGCFPTPSAANSIDGGTLSTNTPDASSGDVRREADTDLCPPVLNCSQSGDDSETSTPAAAAPEPATQGGSNDSRDSASYVTAPESEESSFELVPELLEHAASESETMFLTAMPDGDNTSECSDATLADDDNFASPRAHCVRSSTPTGDCPSPSVSPIPKCASWNLADDMEESALSDLTVDDDVGKGGSSYEDSLAITENSTVDEMRRIANEAAAQHRHAMQNGPVLANGHLCNGLEAPEDGDDSDDEGLVEYDLNDVSSVLESSVEGGGDVPPSPRSAWPPLEDSPMCGEEEEILTVNMLTHEITVRPAAGIVFDDHEVLAGMEEQEDTCSPLGTPERKHQVDRKQDGLDDDAEDTDDTSSTGTSCTSTSGSFECLAQDEADGTADGPADSVAKAGSTDMTASPAKRPRSLEGSPTSPRRASTWDRRATPTKSALKSASGNRRKPVSGKGSTSLRKTVSFHDVISSVHHYSADEEAPPSPPPSAPPSAFDYAGLRDWEFPLCLDEEFPEATNGGSSSSSSSEEEDELPPRGHRGLRSLPVRPRITKLGSTFGSAAASPLYCIAALSHDDLPTTDEEELPTEPSLAEEPSEDLLINQRPPWDSSMSDLSNLDASDDADSLRSESPVRKPSSATVATANRNFDRNANSNLRPVRTASEDSNANSSCHTNLAPAANHH